MKKFITSTLVLLMSLSLAFASDYEKSVRKGIEMLETSKTADASVAATNYFERLSEMHQKEWLPLYYAAYGALKSGFQVEGADAKDAAYQKGLDYIARARAINPQESEILTMEGYLMLMYISNDAMKRAPSQTAEAMELLETAKALNPNNPRPWYVHGQNVLYTPEFFGGGAKNAKPLLEKAVALYKTFTPASDLMPVWGKERCEKLLEQSR